jgi:hypothetical protein
MEITVIDPLADPGWDALVLRSGERTIFHTAAWMRVLAESYGYRPMAFVAGDGHGPRLAIPLMEVESGLTGKRGVSLPFSDSTPPLTLGDAPLDPHESGELLEHIAGHGKRRGWKYFELRGGRVYSHDSSREFREHVLPLTGCADDLFGGFRGSNQRNIRKACRESVEVRFETSPEALRRFYGLHVLNRRVNGAPP